MNSSNDNISNHLILQYQKETNILKKQEIRNKIVEKYYPLVKKISHSVSNSLNRHFLPDELASYGFEGLFKAIDRFDISKNTKFETYANIRIRGTMIDGVRQEDKIPRSVRINNNQLEKTKEILQREKGRKVHLDEIIEKLGISKEEFYKNVKKYTPANYTSLDTTQDEENSEDFKQDCNSYLVDKKSVNPYVNLKRKEFFNKLMSTNFTPLERNIIWCYYYENCTMQDIAKIVNMSESRVSQIHTDILPRLLDKIQRNPKYFSEYLYNFFNKESNC